MRSFVLVLKALSPVFLLVGAMHLVLGLGAEALLGARVPPEALSEPTLDSQNRFYGVAFVVYGMLLYLCATDLARYAPILRGTLWVFFAAGLSRFVSMALYGAPAAPIVALVVAEVLAPPMLLWWLSRLKVARGTAGPPRG